MTPTDILALPPGPELDRHIQKAVIGTRLDTIPAYSTEPSAALLVLEAMPLYVARQEPGSAGYNAAKPYLAGTLAYERSVKGDVTILRVTAPTLAVAICKAALIAKIQQTSAAPGARGNTGPSLAARIGTPAARHPRFAQPTSRLHSEASLQPIPKRKAIAKPDSANAQDA